MSISVACPQCGKAYTVKDEAAGKKFRCKACQAVVSVPEAAAAFDGDPWDNLDLGDPYGESAAAAPVPPTSRRKKKPAGRRASHGMPMAIWVAIGCEVILILGYIVNTARTLDPADFPTTAHVAGAVFAFVVIIVINAGAAYGYAARINTIRWISVALTSLTGLTCLGCGVLSVAGAAILTNNLPADAGVEQGQLFVDGIVMLLTSVVRITLLVCLLLPTSSEWFDR